MLQQIVSNEREFPGAFPEGLLDAAAHQDPYPYYATLLALHPIFREAQTDMWAVLGADEVETVLEHPLCRVRPVAEPVPRAIAGSPAGAVFADLARMNDGDRHAAMKPAIAAAISAFDAADLTATARRTAVATLEEFPLDAGGIDGTIRAYPVRVLAQMIGLGEARAPLAAALTAKFAQCLSPLSGLTEIEQGKGAAAQLLHMLDEAGAAGHGGLSLFKDRLRELGLVPRDAAQANTLGLLLQTYEATAGLIGNTLLALARDPALRRHIGGDDAFLRRLILEVVRHDPPIQNTRRYLAADCVIAGKRMKAGDTILLVLAAANRDPRRYDRPQTLDPARADKSCFTFGAGAHACPGARVAIILAETCIQALIARGLDLATLPRRVGYAASINARIPIFGGPRP